MSDLTEREALMAVLANVEAWPVLALDAHDKTPTLTEAALVADAILAAGFTRKPTITDERVERAAKAVEELRRATFGRFDDRDIARAALEGARDE